MKTDWPIWIGLKARPVAQVARPASQILQSNSGAGSARESYERNKTGLPFLGVPLYTAVTALQQILILHWKPEAGQEVSRFGTVVSTIIE